MRNFIFLTLLILCFYSCSFTSTAKKSPNADSAIIPDAFSNGDSFSLISKSRGDNLIEAIYFGQVDKRPELKILEDNLKMYHSTESDSLASIEKYNGKISQYYESAESIVASMKDSLLKKEMLKTLKESKSEYAKKSAAQTSLLKKLKDQDSVLNDYHTLLEVMVTLPLIKRYENNLPLVKSLPALIAQKQKLIERTKSLGAKK